MIGANAGPSQIAGVVDRDCPGRILSSVPDCDHCGGNRGRPASLSRGDAHTRRHAHRAGASNREMVSTLGVNIQLLYTFVFGVGAALAGLAGLIEAPILTAQTGMGENILIVALVVIIIGRVGPIRGAFMAAIFVGLVDTVGRGLPPELFRLVRHRPQRAHSPPRACCRL
jgi:hypothetical protein